MMSFYFQMRRTLILWTGYLFLAVMLTWPTLLHLTTHLPGDGGDDPAIAWNLWWVKYALLNGGQNPFQSDFMFYPIGINLSFYTLTILNAVTALPLTLNLGVVTASNLHMLFTFVVGAYGTFLLTRYILVTTLTAGCRQPTAAGKSTIGGQWPALSLPNGATADGFIWTSAAIAGGFYAFAGSKLFYVALGQFNIASNHWVPLAVLYILRTHHQPRQLKNPLMAGLFLSLQTWAEMTYASFLLVFIGLYWLFWILDFRFWILDYKFVGQTITVHLRAVVVMLLAFTIGITPVLAQMLSGMLNEGYSLVEGEGFADTFSADLFGFIIPTMHHPLLGNLITQTNIATADGVPGFDKGQHIYIGFVLLGLMLVTLLSGYKQSRLRFWLVATAVFALLALGPVIFINGQSTSISGPFTILQSLPFFKGNRYPSRYSVMLMLSLSVIAAFGLVQIGRWTSRLGPGGIKRYLFLGLIAGLFLFEHASLPLPQSDMQVPPPYKTIAADPGDFTVLDIPFAWRNGFRITGAMTTQFMFGQFYQTTHQKRLLQGNTSRNPEFKFQYFTNAPVINSLLALETGKTLSPEQWQNDQALAADVLRFFNIKYIIIRPYSYDRFDGTKYIAVTEQGTLPYVEAVLPVEKIHDDATIKIYRVKNTDQESGLQSGLHIHTDSPLSSLYFGEGWGLLSLDHPLTAQRKEVRLLVPLTAASQQITLRMRLPDVVQAPTRSVHLELNNWQSRPQQIGPAWQEYTFELPANVVRPGLNDLRLRFGDITTLPVFKAQTPLVDVTVLSAGQEVGNFGHIFVNGYDVSANQRGYNVAIIQPDGQRKTVLRVTSFDTYLDPADSTALANFIDTAPPDTIIAIAAADEASHNLSQEAVLALQSVGAATDLRGCFRCSHAIISAAGIPGRSVIEALDPLRPVGVTTNLGLTEPNVAAVVDWIRIE